MFSEESLETRQRNEFEALNAIYGSDLTDLRKKPRRRWEPMNFAITLTPLQSSKGAQEVHVKVDLHVVCSPKYPDAVPKLFLENSRGISNALLVQLHEELEKKAHSMKGEEMVFQLAQHVQEFLHRHNKPGIKSFYEEMLNRQRKEEQIHRQAEQLERDRKKQIMLEEIQKRQEMLKTEMKLIRASRFDEDEDNTRRSSFGSIVDNNEERPCEHKAAIIEFSNNGFREIQRGSCISHLERNCTIYRGYDKETGEFLAIIEWIIKVDSENEFFNVRKQVLNLEQEFNYLVKLKHKNLLHYLNIRNEFFDSEKKIIVQILQEYLLAMNSKSFLIHLNQTVDLELLRHIVSGVLSALDYLHRNNVVHKDIRDTCVFLGDRGVVKVSNYSVDKRLSDLSLQNQAGGNYNKKTDIYKLGLLILSLIYGNSVTQEIPKAAPPDLHDFLENCLEKDEKKRYTALQLLNHPFLKTKIGDFSPKTENNFEEPERNLSPEIPAVEIKMLGSTQNVQSRVKNEFEFLQHIGTGAYGDVIKVRNNLDGCYYAIKRIELNPKNKPLIKRIVREVKLLSRLNHENVVRYYNSWIETALTENQEGSVSSKSTSVDTAPKDSFRKQLNIKDDVEALAPPIKNVVEWPVSSDTKSLSIVSSSSSSSDDEEDVWMINLSDSSSSDSVQFENSGDNDNSADEDDTNTLSNHSATPSTPTTTSPSNLKVVQFMYIQMEFCEKSTLRTAIDNGLYMEEDRLWRLFREIVEGLAHIHQQGMIHRDLKPVNIFLDVNDHVKIGDFGLATTSMRMRYTDTYSSTNKSLVESDVAESLTGHVGTALYVAPELNSNSKAVYNQKVDIYSLGIILFEMCYPALNTGMERIKILSGIRSKEIVLPQDFKKPENEKKEVLIRWLLDHNISKRPTSQEVLQSELIPPPVLEEREMRELLRHTLNNPQSKAYKYLIASCFKQSFTPAQFITYDKDPLVPNLKPSHIHEIVSSTIKFFKLHGGQNLATPLLMPKSKYYENVETCVKLMTHSGNIVSIPHDLRVPFARYIVWNGITLLRRYSIDRVYREKKVFGVLPKELYECAFDIVTPNKGNLMCDAELLYIVEEIINDLPYLKNKHFLIRLNHTSLIKGILLHCGIKEKHMEVYNILQQVREGKLPKTQLQMYLTGFGLSDSTIAMLFNLLNSEFEINKAVSVMQTITKRKSGEASQLAKQALQELKVVVQNAEAFGVTFDIVVNPGLVYNIQQYSGVIFQIVCELKKKHKRNNMEVLAAGGRYDNMIAEYRSIMEQANMLSKDLHQYGVGVSVSVDKLAQAVQESFGTQFEFLDVVVYSLGSKSLVKEKTKVLRSLWSAGIRACLIEANNMEEIQEQCNELKVPHVIMLKDSEQGSVRVRSWERDRFQEKTVNVAELTENMQKILKNWNENGHSEQLVRSESKSGCAEKQEHGHEANVNVIFVTNEKLSANARRRYDNQIRSQLDGIFKRIGGDIIVLGLTIEGGIVRTIAAYVVFDSEHLFHQSVGSVIDKHQRHKKYLLEICDEIYEQKMKRTNAILILYSLIDSFYKLC